MRNILEANFVREMIGITSLMYSKGWDERNGGNISYLLEEGEVIDYLDPTQVIKTLPLAFEGKELAGRYFITTGSGKYFKNVKDEPEETLGLFRIGQSGNEIEVLWGFANNAQPTSELPSHLMSHIARLSIDPNNRIVMHCHATHTLSMTFTHSLEPRDFTRTLWQMCTECIVVFPDGVEIIPWLVPGTTEIGDATSEKFKSSRVVIWPYHGVYGCGTTMDEAFGLIETVEKAAEVYTIVQAQGGAKQWITDEELKKLVDGFGVIAKEGYLEL